MDSRVEILEENKHFLVMHLVLKDGRCLVASVDKFTGQSTIVASVHGYPIHQMETANAA